MDRTEATVRAFLQSVEAPLYDIGVLSERGMLPGLDSISAAMLLDRLSLLKYRNARGSHTHPESLTRERDSHKSGYERESRQ